MSINRINEIQSDSFQSLSSLQYLQVRCTGFVTPRIHIPRDLCLHVNNYWFDKPSQTKNMQNSSDMFFFTYHETQWCCNDEYTHAHAWKHLLSTASLMATFSPTEKIAEKSWLDTHDKGQYQRNRPNQIGYHYCTNNISVDSGAGWRWLWLERGIGVLRMGGGALNVVCDDVFVLLSEMSSVA